MRVAVDQPTFWKRFLAALLIGMLMPGSQLYAKGPGDPEPKDSQQSPPASSPSDEFNIDDIEPIDSDLEDFSEIDTDIETDADTQIENEEEIVFEEIFPHSEIDHLKKLSSENIEHLKMNEEELAIHQRASTIYNRAIDYANKKRLELGAMKFAEAVDNNLIVFQDKELHGEAEISVLNDELFVRVKLDDYPRLSMNFVDRDMDFTTDWAKRYVSRQNSKGADVLVFPMYQGKIEDIKLDKRVPFFRLNDKKMWKRFYDSWRAMPTAGDIIYLGLIYGAAMQSGVVSGLTVWKTGIPLSEALQRPETIFTAIFALAIGTFIRAYKNFTYSGTKLRRVMCSLLVSGVFAYIYAGITQGLDTLWPGFSGTSTEWWTAAGVHFFLLLNQFVNQIGKDDYFMITRGAEKLRELRGEIKIAGAPALSILHAVHQGIYSLVSFPLKMADQMGIKREAFWGSVVAFRFLNVAYFKFRHYLQKRAYEKNPTDENRVKLEMINELHQEVKDKINIKKILSSPFVYLKKQYLESQRRRELGVKKCSLAFSRFEVDDITMPY